MSESGLFHALYSPAGQFLRDFTRGVRNYRQEWLEGPDTCSFALETGVDDVTDDILTEWFSKYLMHKVITEYDMLPAWEGYIWDLELQLNGVILRKTIDGMANAITVTYTDDQGDTVYIEDEDTGDTLWVTNDESILLYGRRELVINVNTESDDEALERANSEIKYLASPYNIPPSWRETTQNRLTVSCVGRARLANNIKLLQDQIRPISGVESPEYGEETTVSAEILRIVEMVENFAGWIYPLDIATTNETITKVGVPFTAGAFDRIKELARLRDGTGNFYRLDVTADGGVVYRKFNETPEYYFYYEPARVQYLDGKPTKWLAKPGIVRVIDSEIGPDLPDTWLTDKRNIFAERTTMRDGDKHASFHGRKYDVTDYYNALDSNNRWVKEKQK